METKRVTKRREEKDNQSYEGGLEWIGTSPCPAKDRLRTLNVKEKLYISRTTLCIKPCGKYGRYIGPGGQLKSLLRDSFQGQRESNYYCPSLLLDRSPSTGLCSIETFSIRWSFIDISFTGLFSLVADSNRLRA